MKEKRSSASLYWMFVDCEFTLLATIYREMTKNHPVNLINEVLHLKIKELQVTVAARGGVYSEKCRALILCQIFGAILRNKHIKP